MFLLIYNFLSASFCFSSCYTLTSPMENFSSFNKSTRSVYNLTRTVHRQEIESSHDRAKAHTTTAHTVRVPPHTVRVESEPTDTKRRVRSHQMLYLTFLFPHGRLQTLFFPLPSPIRTEHSSVRTVAAEQPPFFFSSSAEITSTLHHAHPPLAGNLSTLLFLRRNPSSPSPKPLNLLLFAGNLFLSFVQAILSSSSPTRLHHPHRRSHTHTDRTTPHTARVNPHTVRARPHPIRVITKPESHQNRGYVESQP